MTGPRQVVNMLTLYAAVAISSKCATAWSRGMPS